MRLQLTVVVAVSAAMLWSRPAVARDTDRGDGATSGTLAVYSDDDATTVTTTLVDADVAVADDVVVGAHALIDVVSSASVDIVSAATSRFNETRVETGGRVGFVAPHEFEIGLALVHSKENDWKSNSFLVSAAREFARKNTRVELSLGFVGNSVGRSGDPMFKEHLSSQTIEIGVTQLIDQLTLASVTYTVQISSGWHSSPYRYVSTSDGQVTVLESHPDTRSRHSLGLRVARYMWQDTAIDAAYRLYRDDWGLLSHTVQSSLRYAPGDNWDLRLRARFYVQGAAHFWNMSYADPKMYMSGDRELSTFWNFSAGAKASRRVGSWLANAKLDLIRYSFLDFELLDTRLAVVASTGVSYQW